VDHSTVESLGLSATTDGDITPRLASTTENARPSPTRFLTVGPCTKREKTG
jgi:hypothetical protein